MRPLLHPKYWLLALALLGVLVALVVLWQSNQELLAVVRNEYKPRIAAPPPRATNTVARAKPAAATTTNAAPGKKAAAQPAPAKAAEKTARAASPADPIIISDNRNWTFSAGVLEGAEEGLLHFGGGIGLAYVDGTWLTGDRADIAFSSGEQEGSTITIPDHATVHIGSDQMNIAGNCVIQSTNGQVTSITADHITITRPLPASPPPPAPAAPPEPTPPPEPAPEP